MTDKLREAAQQALDDDLLTGQAQHLIGALMSRGFLPNTLPTAEYITLWDVVKRQLRCVNKEGARAALAQQNAQAVPLKFLANGTRFKMAFFQNEDGEGNTVPGTHVTCFEAFEHELDGRWVALVPAEDDCHLNAAPTPPAQSCWCQTCRPITINDMRMVLCPTCGNKRCPHANDHRNPCTGSNEPGQAGSAYPSTTPPAQRVMLTDEEIGAAAISAGCNPERDDGALVVKLARAVIEAYEIKNGLKP